MRTIMLIFVGLGGSRCAETVGRQQCLARPYCLRQKEKTADKQTTDKAEQQATLPRSGAGGTVRIEMRSTAADP